MANPPPLTPLWQDRRWPLPYFGKKVYNWLSAPARVRFQMALLCGMGLYSGVKSAPSTLEPEFYFVIEPFEDYNVTTFRFICVLPALWLSLCGLIGCYFCRKPEEISTLRIFCKFFFCIFAAVCVLLFFRPTQMFPNPDVNVIRNSLLQTTNGTQFDDIWITVQNKFDCCGVDKAHDWLGSSRFETEPHNAPTCCKSTDDCGLIRTVEQFNRCCHTGGCLPHIMHSIYEFQHLWQKRCYWSDFHMLLMMAVVCANAFIPEEYWYDLPPKTNQVDEHPLLDRKPNENNQPDAAEEAESEPL